MPVVVENWRLKLWPGNVFCECLELEKNKMENYVNKKDRGQKEWILLLCLEKSAYS